MSRKKTDKKAEDIELREKRRAAAVKLGGLALGLLVVMATVSSVSYIIHWSEDAARVGELHNAGNITGHKLGTFLVRDCFGLASFALIAMLACAAVHLFRRTKPGQPFAKVVLTVSWTLLASTFLSFAGSLFSSNTFFGGGLGGRMGNAVNASLIHLFGTVVGLCIQAFFFVLLMVLSSRRFLNWFATAFESRPKKVSDDNEHREDGANGTQEGKSAASDMTEDGSSVTSDDQIRTFDDTPLGNENTASDEFNDTEDAELDVPKPVTGEESTTAVENVDPDVSGAGSEGDDSVDPSPDTAGTTPDVTIIGDDNFGNKVTEDLPPFDIKDGMENFEAPSLDLLKDYTSGIHKQSESQIALNSRRIKNALMSYKVSVSSVEALPGPTVTLYKIYLSEGVKSAAVKNLDKDLAMALGVQSVRVVNLKDCIGLEVPNEQRSIVPLKTMLDADVFRNSGAVLPVALGYTITRDVKVFDLASAPHLLVAGATMQGKSVCLNVIIASLLYAKHPSELKFVFVDPKMVEFTAYKKLLKHYLAIIPGSANEEEEYERVIVKTQTLADATLKSLCVEMDNRYELLSKAGVNKLKDYNEKYSKRYLLPSQGHRFLPYLVVVIDEYADLIMSVEGPESKSRASSIEKCVIRLAQKGRACGINVIIATQRPSADVVTGLIKGNFPTKIAFKVSTSVNSKVILDQPGAEKLSGKGDGLFSNGTDLDRFQCAMIDTEEVQKVVDFIGNQTGAHAHFNTPYYLPEPPSSDDGSSGGGGMIDMSKLDENFEEAARLVVTSQKASVSDLQRRLGMGFARSGKVMDQLEAAGIVGPSIGSKPREVLIKDLYELEPVLNSFMKMQ